MRSKTAILTGILVAGTVGTAMAIPFPSGIRTASTNLALSAGTTITYNLNQAAATATIEVRDSGNAVVATFAGTTTVGVNSVVWNGTANNAGGAAVPIGTGYRFRVAVTGTEAAGWARYKANGASTSVPIIGDQDLATNWFPKGLAVSTDPDSDFFGNPMVGFGASGTQPAAAVIEFRSDLEVKASDNGLASRVLRHPQDDGVAPVPASYTTWGMYWDPSNSNTLWTAGQSNSGEAEFLFGTASAGVLPTNATNADPGNAVRGINQNPRGIAIQTISGTKYGFLCRGNQIIDVVTINGSNQFASYVGNILAATGWTSANTRYSKNARFDSAGNFYWGSQRVNTTVGAENGKLYRWSAATLAAAIASPGTTPLTEANADWKITSNVAAANQRLAGFAINPANDVYVITVGNGMYNVGNITTTPLTVGVSSLTPVLLNTDFRTGANINGGTSEFWFDAAGNLIHIDGSGENISAFSPGGASSQAYTAPPSQTFQISATGVSDWNLMND
ncbi:MAG: FlgD immunoglobulin-like domain containing protein [Candidatus Sumerlaeota bacterium]